MNIEQLDATARPSTGRRSAANRESLDAILRREQLTPTRIVEKGKEIAIPKPKVAGKVSPKELAIFTRQFSVMIDAGLPLVQCLEILATQQENKGFAKALSEVRGSVEAGSTLANGLRLYPKIFDPLYCNMVEAGETGGILDTILQRLSGYIEKAVKLKRAVQSALIYPIAVVAHCGRRYLSAALESGSHFCHAVCRVGGGSAPAHAHRDRAQQCHWDIRAAADCFRRRSACGD